MYKKYKILNIQKHRRKTRRLQFAQRTHKILIFGSCLKQVERERTSGNPGRHRGGTQPYGTTAGLYNHPVEHVKLFLLLKLVCVLLFFLRILHFLLHSKRVHEGKKKLSQISYQLIKIWFVQRLVNSIPCAMIMNASVHNFCIAISLQAVIFEIKITKIFKLDQSLNNNALHHYVLSLLVCKNLRLL